jgi:uncharacterized protein YdhG (YjbR/CyaY superfamily)
LFLMTVPYFCLFNLFMQIKSNNPEDYLAQVSEEKREGLSKLRDTILEHLPEGFREEMSYGMIGYVVPHDIFPAGYHCDPKLPLPFVSIAAQKNFIALYHMGMYADLQLLDWFTSEYAKRVKGKLDMGKSCVRFKKPAEIPFDLIGKLIEKMSVKDWVKLYSDTLARSKKK